MKATFANLWNPIQYTINYSTMILEFFEFGKCEKELKIF